MATTTISWGDGSGDNIYLTYPSASGDQTVTVTSDANTGAARSKTVTFSATGVSPITLTVNQEAGGPVQYTITRNPSSYDTTDHQYASMSTASRAYTTYDSTTFATINLTTGSQAETWVYFKFNTSAIPAGATIDEVSCIAKTYVSNTATGNVATRRWQLFTGTTAMGNYATIGNLGTQTVSGATWTREQLDDIRIRIYAKRGTSNTSNAFSIRFYGATLTVKYTI